MLRRFALLLALLSPAAALAQIAGQVLILPAAFGVADCDSTSTYVTIAWTSAISPVTGDVYRVYVSNTSSCPSTGTPSGTQLGGDIPALSTTQQYPVSGTLTRHDFIAAAGITSCPAGGTGSTIYVCVQQIGVASLLRASMTGSVPLELSPPPVPVNVSVAPGDSSLFVSWDDGNANGVAAVSYIVTAVAVTNAGDTHTQTFTGRSNNRVSGLTNGVTYSVTVTAVAAGSNESAASQPPVTGTPQPVSGFWELYQADGGREQGGCGGGPAGLLSLLGAALALGGLRRRS